jgi:NAD(P)-dependent dehydrogenase (short-subunit alcohol dehydrogenase family)
MPISPQQQEIFGERQVDSKIATSNDRLAGRVAVVTGASRGIGRAISVALSRHGVRLCVIGRDPARLAETAAEINRFSQARTFQTDLSVDKEMEVLRSHLERESRGLDILIHGAGVIYPNRMEEACIEDLDLQYAVNVRAPYILTKLLLPFLTSPGAQIVFLNSSAGLTAKRPETGQYAASKHALKAIADSLREEVNPRGIRVLSLFMGRTATPMQEALYRHEGRAFHPEVLLQPADVASVVIHALRLPATAEVTDIAIRPMQKSY